MVKAVEFFILFQLRRFLSAVLLYKILTFTSRRRRRRLNDLGLLTAAFSPLWPLGMKTKEGLFDVLNSPIYFELAFEQAADIFFGQSSLSQIKKANGFNKFQSSLSSFASIKQLYSNCSVTRFGKFFPFWQIFKVNGKRIR